MPVETISLLQPRLSPEAIRQQLFGYTVGRRLVYYDTVTSTNAALCDLARGGAPEGTVVLADRQTAGRGRAGTVWFSPPGVNLHLSVLFRPAIPPGSAAPFTFMGSLAVCDAIRELGLHGTIKWPNDVLLDGKKVGGVLAELDMTAGHVRQAILGIGINVNVRRDALLAALGDAGRFATSLQEALGEPVERNRFAAIVLAYLDEWLITFRSEGPAALLRAWRDRDVVIGRRVEVRTDGRLVEGRACGVDEEGALLVQDIAGRLQRVAAGELRLLE